MPNPREAKPPHPLVPRWVKSRDRLEFIANHWLEGTLFAAAIALSIAGLALESRPMEIAGFTSAILGSTALFSR